MKNQKLTKELEPKIIELYENGMSMVAIEKLVRIERHTVALFLKKSGIEIKPLGYHLLGKEKTAKEKAAYKIARAKRDRVPVCAGHNRINPEQKIYNMIKTRCKSKNYEFGLTVEQVKKLIYSICSYCGKAPDKPYNLTVKDPIHGIDRVDSTKGYIFDNCVTCCTMCNRMKSNFTLQEFLDKIIEIVKFRKLLQGI